MARTVTNAFPFALFMWLATTLAGSVPVDAVLAQAREHLGGDAVLNGIESIRYEGTFFNRPDGTGGRFIITLQKPGQQRTEFNDGRLTTITATDGVVGWNRVSDNRDPDRYDLRGLSPKEHRRLRYNTHDNLYFYSRMDRVDGEVEYEKRTIQDGFPAHKLAFYFDDELVFHRFIDVQDGSVIATRNPDGVTVREFGNMWVDGMRFPRRVIAYLDGEEATRLEYERIVLNESYPDSFFEFPTIEPRSLRSPDEELGSREEGS